jgi:hypothetical protein
VAVTKGARAAGFHARVGGSVKVEDKVLVAPEDWAKHEGELAQVKRRTVWFFDTDGRDLQERGVILRLRQGQGADRTVKRRGGVFPDGLEVALEAEEGELFTFKAERDRALGPDGPRSVPAWSLTVDADHDAAPMPRFSLLQRVFASLAGPVPWSDLRPLGPIAAESWKVGELSVERWTIGGERLVEVSRKADGDAPWEEFVAALAAIGLAPLGGDAGGKTRWALARL